MKTQFDIESGNEQISDDDTTTQIQIGLLPILLVVVLIGLIGLWITLMLKV